MTSCRTLSDNENKYIWELKKKRYLKVSENIDHLLPRYVGSVCFDAFTSNSVVGSCLDDSTGLVWDNGMVNMLWFALLTNSLTFWWNVVKPKWREAWTWHMKPTLRCDNHCSPQLTMVTGFEFYVRSASSSMKYIHRRPLQRFSQCGCGQPCLFTSKPFRCVIISDTLCLEQIQKWNKLTTNVF